MDGAKKESAVALPGYGEAYLVYLKIGLLSFGGPVGQIAMMHRELVERRRWLSESRFVHALNYCMFLPGPEAQQLSIYAGWLLHGWRGGVVAGLCFVLPGALFMLGISLLYVYFGQSPQLAAVFYGLQAAVLAIVVQAMMKIGKKILHRRVLWLLAIGAFLAISALKLPFPAVIIGALLFGWFFGRSHPRWFEVKEEAGGKEVVDAGDYAVRDEGSGAMKPATLASTLRGVLVWTFIWLAPVLLCVLLLGKNHVLSEVAWFFSKVAMVTFGGAYAALPYVAQQAVDVHGWLGAEQAMDGLGLAETTPGPLILVLQFVGFLAGFGQAGSLAPWLMGLIAAFLASWATFVPGYLFIFAGAPLIEKTREMPRLAHALAAVRAAVVGVILNLALWFAWHSVRGDGTSWDFLPLVLGGLLFYLMNRRGWGVLAVLGLGILLGGSASLLLSA
ncbi:MAG: chromate efflux transporter [Verrucomicrobiales bacterium]